MHKNASLWAGAFFLVFSLIYFAVSFNYSYTSKLGGGIGPGFLPFWASLIMIVFSIIYIGYAFKKEKVDITSILPDKEGLKNIVLLFAYMIVFAAIVEFVGFTIANTVMLFLMFRGYFKWYKNLGISLGVSVLLYFMFVVFLEVPLPVNEFGW
jgi:Tripartite tricarboxylate transporter TctB family.